MTRKEAIETLIAYACCSVEGGDCDKCPFCDDRCRWNADMVHKAIDVLKGVKQ